MALNVGFLTSKNIPEHDNMLTPYYGVDPIVKYIPKDKIIWCPFDKEYSAFYQTFIRGGGGMLLSLTLMTEKIFSNMSQKNGILL